MNISMKFGRSAPEFINAFKPLAGHQGFEFKHLAFRQVFESSILFGRGAPEFDRKRSNCASALNPDAALARMGKQVFEAALGVGAQTASSVREALREQRLQLRLAGDVANDVDGAMKR
jgi:hypothetical protein